MGGVIHQQVFLHLDAVVELAPFQRMLYGNGQGELGTSESRPGHADTPADQGAQHGKKALVGIFDIGAVAAIPGDFPVFVQQVLAGNGYLVEPYLSVVHAVESQFITIVLDGDAGQQFVVSRPSLALKSHELPSFFPLTINWAKTEAILECMALPIYSLLSFFPGVYE